VIFYAEAVFISLKIFNYLLDVVDNTECHEFSQWKKFSIKSSFRNYEKWR